MVGILLGSSGPREQRRLLRGWGGGVGRSSGFAGLLSSGELTPSSDTAHGLGKLPPLSGLLFLIYEMRWGQDHSAGF